MPVALIFAVMVNGYSGFVPVYMRSTFASSTRVIINHG